MVTTGTELPVAVCAKPAEASANDKQNAENNPFASETG
jgi:hypothetical protein